MSVTRGRLTAEERRAALLETACNVFSRCSYHRATTAEIARGARVTEPILYRHFASKRELYLACLDEAWLECRAMWDAAVSDEPDPAGWVGAMGRSYLAAKDKKGLVANLWIQALTEGNDDPEIRRHVRKHMRDVHDYVADVIRRAQETGGVVKDRDPDAEAWLFLSIGLLTTVGRRLGGLVDDDLPKIFASRRQWMTGNAS
jgi:AcrR family transcriptional regulator